MGITIFHIIPYKMCFIGMLPKDGDLRFSKLFVGVRDLPERDIWSLRVGRGVGGKSMFLPPSPPPPFGLDPKKRGFSDQRFFHHRVLENRSRFTTTAVFLVFAVRVFFVFIKTCVFNKKACF